MVMLKKRLGGYDRDSVDLEMRRRNKREKELQEIIDKLQDEVENLTQQNTLLSHRVTINEKTNEEIARLALKEASELIDKAKRNADMILKESLDYVRSLSGEMEDFKAQAIQFRASVQQMSQDIIETIDESEVFHLINEETKKED